MLSFLKRIIFPKNFPFLHSRRMSHKEGGRGEAGTRFAYDRQYQAKLDQRSPTRLSAKVLILKLTDSSIITAPFSL